MRLSQHSGCRSRAGAGGGWRGSHSTELPGSWGQYFTSKVRRCPGRVRAALCPPSPEFFKETGILMSSAYPALPAALTTGHGRGCASEVMKSIINSVALSAGCLCQVTDNHPSPEPLESAAAALFKEHEGKTHESGGWKVGAMLEIQWLVLFNNPNQNQIPLSGSRKPGSRELTGA